MRLRPVVLLPAALLVASCAVRHESPNGITLEFDANQPEIAEAAATQHCEKYGKKAQFVRASDPAPSPRMLYLDSQIAIFDCVAK